MKHQKSGNLLFLSKSSQRATLHPNTVSFFFMTQIFGKINEHRRLWSRGWKKNLNILFMKFLYIKNEFKLKMRRNDKSWKKLKTWRNNFTKPKKKRKLQKKNPIFTARSQSNFPSNYRKSAQSTKMSTKLCKWRLPTHQNITNKFWSNKTK